MLETYVTCVLLKPSKVLIKVKRVNTNYNLFKSSAIPYGERDRMYGWRLVNMVISNEAGEDEL